MSEQYHFVLKTPRGNYQLKANDEIELSSWNSAQTVAIIRNLVSPGTVTAGNFSE